MMDDTDENLRAALANIQLERVATYVRRGRRFAHEPLDVLRAEWVKSFKSWSETFESAGCYDAWNDYESELDIRGERAPYEEVARELTLLDRRARDVAKCICEDPARRAELRRFLKREGYFSCTGKDVKRKTLN